MKTRYKRIPTPPFPFTLPKLSKVAYHGCVFTIYNEVTIYGPETELKQSGLQSGFRWEYEGNKCRIVYLPH